MSAYTTELQRMFDGQASKNEYNQYVAVEVAPTSWVNGAAGGFKRNFYSAKVEEEVFRFVGLTYGAAHSTETVRVADVGGKQYDVQLASKIVDGSSGTAYFEKEAVVVNRSRMSPHLWALEVTHKRAALYKGGTEIIAMPASWEVTGT